MERLKGFLIILLCNLAGNIIIMASGLPVPGSVLGMLMLLILLLTGRVKLATVEPAASLLIAFMLLFILPDGVKLMNSFHKFEGIVAQVLIIAVLSTLLTMVSSSLVTQHFSKRLKPKQGRTINK